MVGAAGFETPTPCPPDPRRNPLCASLVSSATKLWMHILRFETHDPLLHPSQVALGHPCHPPLSAHVYWAGVGYFEPSAVLILPKPLKSLALPRGLEPVFSP